MKKEEEKFISTPEYDAEILRNEHIIEKMNIPKDHVIILGRGKMTKQERIEEEVKYKVPVLFMRKSRAGEHLYAFNVEKKDAEGMVLGNEVGSILLNVSEIIKLVDGKLDWIKVSVLPPKDAENSA